MQPGMVANRHFQIVAVTISPFLPRPNDAGVRANGFAGPNGGVIEARATTRDGAFEVVVSIGALLPNVVSIPELDLDLLASKLAAAYNLQI